MLEQVILPRRQGAPMSDVVTSGVLLRNCKYFIFQTGLNGAGDALGVVRLGGHVEPGETSIECARREALEEGNVVVDLVAAPATWSYSSVDDAFDLVRAEELPDPAPLLTASMAPDDGLSVTYLATCTSEPTPGMETQALIFLTIHQVFWLTGEGVTLGEFLGDGGLLTESAPLPRDLRLHPHGQLRALAYLVRSGELDPGWA